MLRSHSSHVVKTSSPHDICADVLMRVFCKKIRSCLGFCLLLSGLLFCVPPTSYAKSSWLPLDEGLSLGTFPLTDDVNNATSIVVLRINPRYYRFTLLTKSEFGKARTPRQWAKDFKLTALINASMYLPDQSTSTGYMRAGKHINNKRINKKFGAFFLAEPLQQPTASQKKPSKKNAVNQQPQQTDPPPSALLLDTHYHNWKELLPRYSIAIQNFRMISAKGKNLWTPEGRAFSIAAIGDDYEGNILFIQCHPPFSVHNFADKLQDLPIDLRQAMYVEGGSEASLHVRSKVLTRTWSGRHAAEFWTSDSMEHVLPNVLGIIKK